MAIYKIIKKCIMHVFFEMEFQFAFNVIKGEYNERVNNFCQPPKINRNAQ